MSRTVKHLTPDPQFFGTAGYPVPRGGVYVWPWGEDNLYPRLIQSICLENGVVQNIIRKKTELLWGAGPALYTSRFEAGRRRQQWVRHEGIERWLSSWDLNGYLQKVTGEFILMNGFFTKWICDCTPFKYTAIISLEHIPCDQARFVWQGDDVDPAEVLIGDYSGSALFGFNELPIFNAANIRIDEQSVSFDRLPQALVDDFYPRSAIHGSLSWIMAGAGTASALTSMNENSMSVKYHIEAPALYWENQREKLIRDCERRGETYNENMLERLKDETFAEITAVFSGVSNAGKFIATERMFDEVRNRYLGWNITILNHPGIRDYTGGQMKVARESAYNIAAGIGMHPELSSITKKGALSGGSELLYSAKIFRAVSVDIAEKIIFRPLNDAISINFNNPGIRLGFDRESI